MEVSKRVGFWPRVGAALVDFVFLLPFVALFGGVGYYLESNGRYTPQLDYVFGIAATLGAAAYGSFEIFNAGTPGRLLLGQRIVTLNGTPATTATLANRYLVKHAPDLIGLVGSVSAVAVIDKVSMFASLAMLIGCFMVLGAARQAPWDQFAGTIVARKKDLDEMQGFQPLMTVPVQPAAPVAHPVADGIRRE